MVRGVPKMALPRHDYVPGNDLQQGCQYRTDDGSVVCGFPKDWSEHFPVLVMPLHKFTTGPQGRCSYAVGNRMCGHLPEASVHLAGGVNMPPRMIGHAYRNVGPGTGCTFTTTETECGEASGHSIHSGYRPFARGYDPQKVEEEFILADKFAERDARLQEIKDQLAPATTDEELAGFFELVRLKVQQKEQAYAGAWREQGWRGNVARVLSKAKRLKNMLWRTNTMDNSEEPVNDTLIDLVALAAFTWINRQKNNEWGSE
jgi:hypothetical protein